MEAVQTHDGTYVSHDVPAGSPMTPLIVDPALRDVLFGLEPMVKALLKERIRSLGPTEPVYIRKSDRVILDGHVLYETYTELGITDFRVVEIECADDAAARKWRIEHNLARRHVNAYQRCICALALEVDIAAKAKQNMAEGGKTKAPRADKCHTDDKLADIAGVSILFGEVPLLPRRLLPLRSDAEKVQ